MGRLAAASLIRAIRDGTPPEGRRLAPELVVRESTRPQP
jgi:DNA-binding LacI/PurR family transcriptional regulator